MTVVANRTPTTEPEPNRANPNPARTIQAKLNLHGPNPEVYNPAAPADKPRVATTTSAMTGGVRLIIETTVCGTMVTKRTESVPAPRIAVLPSAAGYPCASAMRGY